MHGNIEVHDVTTVMAEHDKDIENAKCGSRDGEEIDTGYTVGIDFRETFARSGTEDYCVESRTLQHWTRISGYQAFSIRHGFGGTPTNVVP